MIRAAICGFGALGRSHADSLARMDGVKVEAICDIRMEQIQAKDIAFNVQTDRRGIDVQACRLYTDLRQMLEAEKPDVVATALPTDVHAEAAVAAMEAGAHVFTEKPMALTVAQCDQMLEASRRCGRQLMVAQCLRFWPEYEALVEIIRSGRYGRLQTLTLERVGSYTTWSAGNWMNDHHRSGGAILDLHLHDVDWVWHALGKPRRLCAAGLKGKTGGVDDVTAVWDYAGTVVTLRGSWMGSGFTMSFRAYFENASVEFGVHPDTALRVWHSGAAAAEKIPVAAESGYVREMAYFIDCVRGRHANAVCPAESTRESVALVMKEAEAIEKGRWVEIE